MKEGNTLIVEGWVDALHIPPELPEEQKIPVNARVLRKLQQMIDAPPEDFFDDRR